MISNGLAWTGERFKSPFRFGHLSIMRRLVGTAGSFPAGYLLNQVTKYIFLLILHLHLILFPDHFLNVIKTRMKNGVQVQD